VAESSFHHPRLAGPAVASGPACHCAGRAGLQVSRTVVGTDTCLHCARL